MLEKFVLSLEIYRSYRILFTSIDKYMYIYLKFVQSANNHFEYTISIKNGNTAQCIETY